MPLASWGIVCHLVTGKKLWGTCLWSYIGLKLCLTSFDFQEPNSANFPGQLQAIQIMTTLKKPVESQIIESVFKTLGQVCWHPTGQSK